LILGEVCGIAMLVSVSAVIGRANNLQLLIIAVSGIFFYTLNEAVTIIKLQYREVAGAMVTNGFGAFYGLGLAIMYRIKKGQPAGPTRKESYESNVLSMVGTLFIWCFRVSSNSGLANSPAEIHMATLNTYFSMIGSVCSAYVTSDRFAGRPHP